MRPVADPNLEQFLMEDEGMVEQVLLLSNHLDALTDVVFIGDDDHVSLLLAKFLEVRVRVFDVDQRVVDSINLVAAERGLSVSARYYDVRDEFPEPGGFQFFYVNPPYSSKNHALGVKVWLMRALDAVGRDCDGVLVFPGISSHREMSWVASNVLEFTRYLLDSDSVVTAIESDKHSYIDTNDRHLYSTNYLIHRVGLRPAPRIAVPDDAKLYR